MMVNTRISRLAFAGALLVLAGLSACGDDSGLSRVEKANLVVSDTQGSGEFLYLQFENLDVPGESSDVAFTVTKEGKADLVIASVDAVYDDSGWIRAVAEVQEGTLPTQSQEFKLRMERPNVANGGSITRWRRNRSLSSTQGLRTTTAATSPSSLRHPTAGL